MKTIKPLTAFFKENIGFAAILLLLFASRSSLADWYYVPSGSMLPTIVEGDRIFVDRTAYRIDFPFTDIGLIETGTPARGDIVVFTSEKAGTRLVKRVIGLPGDSVAMLNNHLIINGQAVTYSETDESVVFHEQLPDRPHKVQFIPVSEKADTFAPVTVPQDHVLVLGDNRNNSMDSRYYGFVPMSEIQGKALSVLVSTDADNYYLPRTERSFTDLM